MSGTKNWNNYHSEGMQFVYSCVVTSELFLSMPCLSCRQKQSPNLPFIFDTSLIDLTSTGVTADELIVNDLTMEQLQHKYVNDTNELFVLLKVSHQAWKLNFESACCLVD